jgi:signal transduction histidine kinase
MRELHTSRFTGDDVISVAAPILVDGKFSGVIIVNFNAEKIFKITTDRTGLGEIGEIYILNRDGYMITPSRFINDTLPKQDVDPEHFTGTENYEPEAVLYKDYRGVDVLGAHAPIPAMNWCLVAEIDEEEAFAPVAKLTNALFLILAALLLVGAVICTRVSGTITDPIVELYRGTEEIMKGNLDYKVGTETVDEVGEELKEYSRGLETKVEKRTARLGELLTESERQRAAIANIAHDLKDANIELSAEIDERKSAEARIEHLNNVLKAVRDINKLIVTEKDRGSLLKKACDILTETRGYEAAWLGSLGNGETFDMVVGSGFREDVDRFSETVMDGNHTPCVKKALAGKETVVVVDKSGCGDCPFGCAHNGRETVVIRVERGGKLFGLLAISLATDVTLDEEEGGLLEEVASDIALALRNMEMEEAHKAAEDRVKASLKEKEVLLREIHHRVKNNLQVVSSLLDMQARRARNKDAIDVLTESKNRINTMALIHAQLYESRDLSEINMRLSGPDIDGSACWVDRQ